MNIKREDLDVLLSEEQIQTRIKEIGAQITEAYKDRDDLHVIAVLKGSFMFLTDLVKAIDLELTVDFLGLSSYGDSTETSGVVRMTQDLSLPIKNRHVLVVEDIVDTGLTLKYLVENLQTRHPASLAIVSLLDKPENRTVDVDVQYTGFTIPNEFVIGYGLDYAEKFRNLPFIGVVRKG